MFKTVLNYSKEENARSMMSMLDRMGIKYDYRLNLRFELHQLIFHTNRKNNEHIEKFNNWLKSKERVSA